MSTNDGERVVKVNYLARVEGEGALYIKLAGNEVVDVRLQIFEAPRFFESLLRGRQFTEAPDITSRICGICPIAYQSSSINAMENICGVRVEGPLRALRRLTYCGEWIESHMLHVAMLHAPDFLGYDDGMAMAKDHPDAVRKALQLKKAGNRILARMGGREIHPVNLRVGGFYRAPSRDEVESLREDLVAAADTAEEWARWTGGFEAPDFNQDYEFVAMRHPDEYPMWEGRLVSNKGLDIDPDEFDDHFEEVQVQHSTALHAVLKDRGAYLMGPIARYNLNFDQLTPRCRAIAADLGLEPPMTNPYRSIAVRCLEVLYACEEAVRLIDAYETPDRDYIEVTPKAGRGSGCSEAPRGTCHHTYEIDDAGFIQCARIAPPTSQNQRSMEEDLRALIPSLAELDDDALARRCEQAVRNYDPCISCSAHFLNVDIDRE